MRLTNGTFPMLLVVPLMLATPGLAHAQSGSKGQDKAKPVGAQLQVQPQLRVNSAQVARPQIKPVEQGRFTALPDASRKLAQLDPAVVGQLRREQLERPRRLGPSQWSQDGDHLYLVHPHSVAAGGARMGSMSMVEMVLNATPGYRYLVDCGVIDTPTLHYIEEVPGRVGMSAAVSVPVRGGVGAFVIGPYDQRRPVSLSLMGQVTAPYTWQFQACEITPIRPASAG